MATHRIGQPDCFDLELVRVLPLGRIAISHFVPPYSRSYQLLAVREIEARSKLAGLQGRPYQGVVGHGPDTTWTGKAEGYRWLDQNYRVNSSLGGQSTRYPIGFKPTGFVLNGLQ